MRLPKNTGLSPKIRRDFSSLTLLKLDGEWKEREGGGEKKGKSILSSLGK